MKKIISILLAVMLVVSVATVSFGAIDYNPSDSYTVSKGTPTCEEAIKACNGGKLGEVQHIYFQLPAVVPGNEDNTTWTNQYNSTDLGLDYCQVCIYWWEGIAGSTKMGWPNGKGCTWVGYKTKLVDAENRIYEATVPADGNTPLVTWNNGVNAGMDSTKPIFKYGRQLADANIEGALEGDYDTLPEGSPVEGNMDGCIAVINYDPALVQHNPITDFDNYGNDWYVYYGKGCYGEYPTTSDHFVGRYENCKNPEHLANPDKYHPLIGDVNKDKTVNIVDVFCIQRYLVKLPQPGETKFNDNTFNKTGADVDGDTYISIIDATRIQRALAGLCDIETGEPLT